ncbi:hypothetical protein EJ06DRAFT_134845 [Trichodelitschia bisporula]|uniref:Uncharacterized protein n=1 Tax=Trichodelitschia bisporula TaxID=703511 RepID=A0A6G1HNU4_9PEZI|nr:hypothetical protein EJ06DRAFT_134845 [Trichodelitschia bisporula]
MEWRLEANGVASWGELPVELRWRLQPVAHCSRVSYSLQLVINCSVYRCTRNQLVLGGVGESSGGRIETREMKGTRVEVGGIITLTNPPREGKKRAGRGGRHHRQPPPHPQSPDHILRPLPYFSLSFLSCPHKSISVLLCLTLSFILPRTSLLRNVHNGLVLVHSPTHHYP